MTRFAWDISHPSAKIGGGFWVRTNIDGELPPGSTSTNPSGGPRGVVMLMLVRDIRNAINPGLTTKAASMIDVKMDDGHATRGDVQGGVATCFAAGNDSSYNFANNQANRCTLNIALIK